MDSNCEWKQSFPPGLRTCDTESQLYALIYILYIRDLSIFEFWYLPGRGDGRGGRGSEVVLEPIPCRYRRMNKVFGKSKVINELSIVWDISTISPCIVQGSTVFHCKDIPHFIYPLINWWILGLFPLFGYYEQYNYKHLCTYVSYLLSIHIGVKLLGHMATL